jgi:hypothetical protein
MDLGVLELMPSGVGSGSAARCTGACCFARNAAPAAWRATAAGSRARRGIALRRSGCGDGTGSRARVTGTGTASAREQQP